MGNNYVYLRGGSEQVMFQDSAWLRAKGHAVWLFGRCRPEDEGLPHADLLPPLNGTASGIAGRLKVARETVYNGSTGRRFAAFCERTRPDVVHCHNIYGGLTTAVIDACRDARVPCVVTLHDAKLACPSYLMLNRGKPCELCVDGGFYHCLLTRCHKNSALVSLVSTVEAYYNSRLGKWAQADFLIAPSRFLLERVARAGIPRHKLRWIPNGINPGRFRPVYGDEGYCLYAGRLSHEKGLDTLLQAASGCGMPLRIAGEGPEGPRLREWAALRGHNHVSFEGRKSGREFDALMQGAAFLVVPSICHENASMAVLEAMAYGKPVIASRMGGLPEQVDPEGTGLLFEAGNAEELRGAMLRLAADSCLRQAMGCAARRAVEERFSLDHHGAQTTQLYEEAIRG